MKVPISNRLLLCASMVPQGARVADIGCDHGYLGIYLLLNNQAQYVFASDLNIMPMEAAMRNAEKFGVAEKMKFTCASGLAAVAPDDVDTIVCCGMGGDLIRTILEQAPWVRDGKYTLILQPQHAAAEFRKWLFEEGFELLDEQPMAEDGHIYFAMKLRYTGIPFHAEPWQLYVTPQMLQSGSIYLFDYLDHVMSSLSRTAEGLKKAVVRDENKIAEITEILREIAEMRDQV